MSVELPVVAPPRASWHRPVALAAMVAAIALLALDFAWFVDGGAKAIRYPFEIDYGEGIVWQQALRIASGDAYGSIDHYPAIVFHYPPFYHLISLATAAILGLDQLAAGRAVSLVSTVLIGGFAGLIVFRALARRHRQSGGVDLCGGRGPDRPDILAGADLGAADARRHGCHGAQLRRRLAGPGGFAQAGDGPRRGAMLRRGGLYQANVDRRARRRPS